MQTENEAISPSTHPVNTLLEAVGPRLRDLRQRRELKLSDVAASSGLSTSTLSRLESGLRRPTLDVLIPLAQIYRVALDDLVGAPPTGDPRVHPKAIKRHGSIYLPLTRPGAPIQAFKMLLPRRRGSDPVKQARHGGYEWLYVLSGSVDLFLDGVTTTLEAGEAAEFDTTQAHAIVSSGDHPTEILTLFSPQGEEIHIRDS